MSGRGCLRCSGSHSWTLRYIAISSFPGRGRDKASVILLLKEWSNAAASCFQLLITITENLLERSVPHVAKVLNLKGIVKGKGNSSSKNSLPSCSCMLFPLEARTQLAGKGLDHVLCPAQNGFFSRPFRRETKFPSDAVGLHRNNQCEWEELQEVFEVQIEMFYSQFHAFGR